MRTHATLATLLVGLASVFLAPAAKADCPHNGTDFDHPHCDGGEPPAPSNEFRFIGFTNDATNALADTIDGGQGMLAMHALCQDDFGPDARLCTSEEFWLSPNAEAPTVNSWLHSVGPGGTSDFMASSITRKSCQGWATSSDQGTGMVVKPDGKPEFSSLLHAGCDVARPVTCCAPLQ
jgi:hypothetical protein